MTGANEKTITKKTGRGRPATGLGQLIGVRLQPDLLAALDAYIQSVDPDATRPEAVRRALSEWLEECGHLPK